MKKRTSIAAVSWLVSLFVGCSSTPALVVDGGGCAEKCGAGLSCVAGKCAPTACASNAGCSAPESCVAGFCADESCAPPCQSTQVCLSQVCVPKVASACTSTASCPSGESCLSGFCSDTDCTPPCSAGDVCLSQVCIPPAGSGCAAPYVACQGASGTYCANLELDSSNCGGCGQACTAGQVCNGLGQCATSCASAETLCGNRCVDVNTDEQNCGACGTACPAGQACSNGACAATCAASYALCGAGGAAYCADEASDPSNCGACGNVCPAGEVCTASTCVEPCPSPFVLCGPTCTDTRYDPNNCGTCAHACPAGDYCALGACTAPPSGGPTGGTTTGTSSSSSTTSGVGSPTLSLLAGGLGGPGDVDGVGAATRFDYPSDVADDGLGDLFVADTLNCRIRKIVKATGAVTTLAGSICSLAPVDGLGPAATFRAPSGLAYAASNLYVTDQAANTLRQISVATGAVTTFAGGENDAGSVDGTGLAARFVAPDFVTYDGIGTLYVSDYAADTIRAVVIASGAVTTLAGTASSQGSADGVGAAARFFEPLGLADDGAGNLYVVDDGNATIRAIAVASATVTTLAGTAGNLGSADGVGAAARFFEPMGVAYDGIGNLYVTDNLAIVRQIALASRSVTTVAGTVGVAGFADGVGAAVTFDVPAGMAFGNDGFVYVADSSNDEIRALAAANDAVTTLAGDAVKPGTANGTGAAARFFQPSFVAYDGAGTLYVADSQNEVIRSVDALTGAVTTLAGNAGQLGSTDGVGAAARFYIPAGLALDGAGNLYVADSFNFTIRQIVAATGAVTTLAGTAGQLGSADGVAAAASFNYPEGLALDGAGNLYLADSFNNTIRQIAVATGTVTTLAGTAGQQGSADGAGAAASFRQPTGIATDGVGNLYVTDYGNDTLRQIVVATAAVTTIAGTAGVAGAADGVGAAARFHLPQGVTYDGAGDLYVADTGNSEVRKIAVATGAVTTWVGAAGRVGIQLGPLPASLNSPAGLAYAPSTGQLFITDEIENAILVAQ